MGGSVQEAKKVVSEMPMELDSYVLGALLNRCREHGEVELANETARKLAELGLVTVECMCACLICMHPLSSGRT